MMDKIERLDRLLRSVNHGIMGSIRSAAEEHGISHQALMALRYVRMRPGITVSEIARQTGMAKSNVSRIVDQLVGMGVLEKRDDPADQRLVRLHVTPRAEEHFQAVHEAVRAKMASVLACLAPEQVDTLIAILESIQAAMADPRGTASMHTDVRQPRGPEAGR